MYLSEEVAVTAGAVGEGGLFTEPAAVRDDDVINIREEQVFLRLDQ